jgi:hypothetical protein
LDFRQGYLDASTRPSAAGVTRDPESPGVFGGELPQDIWM